MNSVVPEHYLMMIPRFKQNFDTTSDPENAFVKGTPQWIIDEWVEFNNTSYIDL